MARDVAQVSGDELCDRSAIGLVHVVQAAERLGIDEHGLDHVEQSAVKLLLELRRPMGVEALASRLAVDLETFRGVHEPWLERSGLVERTERGRVATGEARALYGSEVKAEADGPESSPHTNGQTPDRLLSPWFGQT